MTYQPHQSEDTALKTAEPGWKRNGRNGPFDWWLACVQHGGKWMPSCMSCGMAIAHNIEFEDKLRRELATPSPAPTEKKE